MIDRPIVTRRRSARLVALITAGLVTLGPILAQPASASISPKERRLGQLVNDEREARGRPKLAHTVKLSELASEHSTKMMEREEIFHSSPGQLRGYMHDANCVALIGENVGAASSVPEMHEAFMASPGHRANILEKNWVKMGMGIRTASDGRLWVTQLFCV
jgi:uncharacterized protein YkwD